MRNGHNPSSDPDILKSNVQQGDTPGDIGLTTGPSAKDSQLDRRWE